MAAVRERYWIPRLRYLTKRIIKNCHGCKRFHAVPFPRPPVGNLPTDRTTGHRPFQVVGIDYAGPIAYKINSNQEGKSYILLISCSLTRAVHLEVLPDLTVKEFKHAFKQFMARRGRPQTIYSDNAKTFCAASKWAKRIINDEDLNDYLAKMDICWKFNLSRAPWWGGQFERLIGLMKQTMYKVIGHAALTWKELVEVVLDVEVSMNNRPLTYVEEDDQPVLTPNQMINAQSYAVPEDGDETDEELVIRKRMRYVKRIKQRIWKRWTEEYVRGLRERHNQRHNRKVKCPEIGEVVLVRGDDKNRGKWTVGVVQELFEGRDGVVRGVELKTAKSVIDRPIQMLYPLELKVSTDPVMEAAEPALNPQAPAFRPRRRAGQVAQDNIKNIIDFEQ